MYTSNTTSMIKPPKGLPLTRSHIEQIFPKLTSAQIRRITARGQTRAMRRGKILYEQGDIGVPFFVVVSGELEVVRPLGTAAAETLVRYWDLVSSLAKSARSPADLLSFACVSLSRVR